MRICTVAENNMNKRSILPSSSKYKGVSWHIIRNKWISHVKHNKKTHHLGYFDIEEDAALAYNQKAKELFGEFANLNKFYSI